MKRINYFTLAALAMLSLAGCTQDDERAADLPMTGMPLRPVAHVDAPVTREAMTTETLDHYYFRVADADGGTDEYDYFTTMTLEDGQWKADQEMTWQSTFPKVSAMEQKGEIWSKEDYINGKDISLPTDQSTHDNLLKSDVLYMTPTGVTAEGLDDENNIKVNLKHLFAKLKVVVNVTGVPFNPIKSLVIGDTKTTATFTPETGVLGEATNEATITACQDGTTNNYECILLPQDVAANTLTVNVTLSDGTTKGYTYPNPLELNSNYQYTLSLTMQANMTMTPGDVTMEEGWSDGVVDGEMEEGAEISKDGKTYTVSTARGLLQWANAAAEGGNPNLTLTANINMEGKEWPCRKEYSGGTIDGGGHTISNLMITPNDVNVGLIAKTATKCNIKNLTLLNPQITSDAQQGGFFIGGTATGYTIENCHVIGGTINYGVSIGGLTNGMSDSNFTACSVTSSGVDMIREVYSPYEASVTACYVIGGKLVGEVMIDDPTYTASYYQENADGGIMDAEGNPVDSWSDAMNAMNQALSSTTYQWEVNTDEEDTDRPLVIKTQPTN